MELMTFLIIDNAKVDKTVHYVFIDFLLDEFFIILEYP